MLGNALSCTVSVQNLGFVLNWLWIITVQCLGRSTVTQEPLRLPWTSRRLASVTLLLQCRTSVMPLSLVSVIQGSVILQTAAGLVCFSAKVTWIILLPTICLHPLERISITWWKNLPFLPGLPIIFLCANPIPIFWIIVCVLCLFRDLRLLLQVINQRRLSMILLGDFANILIIFWRLCGTRNFQQLRFSRHCGFVDWRLSLWGELWRQSWGAFVLAFALSQPRHLNTTVKVCSEEKEESLGEPKTKLSAHKMAGELLSP